MFYIMSKKNRGIPYIFQDENGNQKVARFFFKENAEKMLKKMGDEFYIVQMDI